MKKLLYTALVFTIILSACNSSDQSDSEPIETDTVTETETVVDSGDLARSVTNVPSLWKVEQQNNNAEKLKKPDNDSVSLLTPQTLIQALNATYPDIQLVLNRISHDTIYIGIPKSQGLTEQLGSTGAYNYMATAVYNLTELNKVKFVNFQFQVGDHAEPGTYSRDDFKRLR